MSPDRKTGTFLVLVAVVLLGVSGRPVVANDDSPSFPRTEMDWSGTKTETLFFLLGMLDAYPPRRYVEGTDLVESFYCNEQLEAFVFLAYLDRLAREQGIEQRAHARLVGCHLRIESEPLRQLINSFHLCQQLSGSGRAGGTSRIYYSLTLLPEVFDGRGQGAKLAFLAGAYFRYGRDGEYWQLPSGRDPERIARMLRDVGATDIRVETKLDDLAKHGIRFTPSTSLKRAFDQMPGEAGFLAADSLAGMATDDELAIYREVIQMAQQGAFDGCAPSIPAIIGPFTFVYTERASIPADVPWMRRALAAVDSASQHIVSLRELARDGRVQFDRRMVTRANHHLSLSQLSLSSIGFDPEGEGAVVFVSYTSLQPGSCAQSLAVFLRLIDDAWTASGYSVSRVHRQPLTGRYEEDVD
jgi:hypothetical protein